MVVRNAFLVLLIAACDAGPGTPPPAAPLASSVGEPLGDPPPLVEEPETLPDRSSPEALLRSVLAARTDARNSLAFLARAELPTARKPQLDKLDEARAWRHFGRKSMGPYWAQIEEAIATGNIRVEVSENVATAIMDVGGAVGTRTLSFEKVDGQWFLSLGN